MDENYSKRNVINKIVKKIIVEEIPNENTRDVYLGRDELLKEIECPKEEGCVKLDFCLNCEHNEDGEVEPDTAINYTEITCSFSE